MEHFKNSKMLISTTDTVWGIIGILDKETEQNINRVKGAPLDKPITVMVNDLKQAKKLVAKHHHKYILETSHPTTYILDASDEYKEMMGRDQVGVRIVDNSRMREIIAQWGPLLSSSCNKHGEEIMHNFDDISKAFEGMEILEPGTQSGNPSRIIRYVGDEGKEIR